MADVFLALSDLPGLASRALSPLVDALVVPSFDRTGYRIHSWGFREGDLQVDMTRKVCLVTGANSGIGRQVAMGLAERGARVHLLCRSRSRGEDALDDIACRTGNRSVFLEQVDVSEQASLRAFATRFAEKRVDVLVHNAGVLPDARCETSEGRELTFATNVLGPFLLTRLLVPRLARSEAARVIFVSSGGMYGRRLQVADPEWRRRAFDGVAAYAESKRAEVVLSEMWAEALADRGVRVNCMHPGWADTRGVRTSLPRFHRVMQSALRTPAEGADTALWLACARSPEDVTGRFWFDRRTRSTHWLPWTRESDEERRALWDLCEELCRPEAARVELTC